MSELAHNLTLEIKKLRNKVTELHIAAAKPQRLHAQAKEEAAAEAKAKGEKAAQEAAEKAVEKAEARAQEDFFGRRWAVCGDCTPITGQKVLEETCVEQGRYGIYCVDAADCLARREAHLAAAGGSRKRARN